MITHNLHLRKIAAPQDRGAGGPAISNIQTKGKYPVRVDLASLKEGYIIQAEPFSESMQNTLQDIHEDSAMPNTQDMAEIDPTFDQGFSEDASISDFLSRPVKIASHTWSVGGDLAAVGDPWLLLSITRQSRTNSTTISSSEET
mgnify:CR=1 FL=1